MNAKKISDKVFWVGKVDNRKVPFHRLILERGTTYNSYLLMTEKPTVIDTVDIMFGKEYVDNLSKVIDLEKLEYIVINHVEPDHAGALPALAAKAKQAKIVTTELGVQLLKDMFKLHQREFIAIKDGDTLDIGGKTLQFFETPFLHTEETMITYSVEDGYLYPCDQFSTHIATEELFNDQVAEASYLEDFKVYYNLIMNPHRPYVRDMLEKLKKLEINLIAPSHGFILKNPEQFIKIYDELSKVEKGDKKVAIIYSSMTGNTTKIAQKLAEGVIQSGVDAEVYNLNKSELSDLKAKISEFDGILVGSSTKYGDMVGNIEEFLQSLKNDNSYENKLSAAFGSYGWSGEAIIQIEDYLGKAGFKIINQRYLIEGQGVDAPIFPLRIKFSREEELNSAKTAGRIFGEEVLTKA